MKMRNLILTSLVFSAGIGLAITAISDDSMSPSKRTSERTLKPRSYLNVPNQMSPSSFRISAPSLRSDIDVAGITYLGEN
jgi:hypothetical protein